MVGAVSDYRSNPNEHVVHAVNVLKRAPRRIRVFMEIYRGKKKTKTVGEIARATGLTRLAVLQEGGRLASEQLVTQTKVHGETAYTKERVYVINKPKIQRFIKNPKALEKLPTKQSPKSKAVTIIRVPGLKVRALEVTCDDFDEFAKVRKIRSGTKSSITEDQLKDGIKRLIGETGRFKDWPGEKSDLWSSKFRIKGQRRRVAIQLKGPGMNGILTPAKLGKNGDQIQRLFESTADVHMIQYHGQISETVLQQMQAFAQIKSIKESRLIWYGLIDGDDTNRLLTAYPEFLKK